MKTNRAGLNLIEEFEGLSLKAYASYLGNGKYDVWTIGYGHTSEAGAPNVHQGMTITKEEADQILASDLSSVESHLQKLVHVPLNSNQFSALVSFTFNLGEGNLTSSTLLRRLNSGDYDIGNEFLKWTLAQGQRLPGLVRRRQAEKELWESGTVLTSPVSPDRVPEQENYRPQAHPILEFVYWLIQRIFGVS